MDRNKLIQNLERKVSENKHMFLPRDGKLPADEARLKAHILLTKLYNAEGNFSKALKNYYLATQELKKVSKEKIDSLSLSFGHVKYLNEKEKAEKKIKGYESSLKEFAEKNYLGEGNFLGSKENVFADMPFIYLG